MHLLATVLALATAPLPPSLPDPVQPRDSIHWKASGEFAFTDVSGNRSLSLLAAKATLNRVGGHILEASTSFGVRYGRSAGETAVDDYAAGAELRFLPQGVVSPFVSITGARDNIRRVRLRMAVAAGADLNVVREKDAKLALGLALLQDYERIDAAADSAAPAATSLTRLSMRITGTVPLNPSVSLVHRSQLQPVAGDLSDYLFTSETGFRVRLSRVLAIKTTYIFNRDTTPADGVEFRNDRTLTIGLAVGSG